MSSRSVLLGLNFVASVQNTSTGLRPSRDDHRDYVRLSQRLIGFVSELTVI